MCEFQGKTIKQFYLRENIPIVVKKIKFKNYFFVKVINQTIDENNICVYIHGGPNINFMQYIEDTANKMNRTVENILSVSNILFVDQYINTSLEDCNLSEIVNGDGNPKNLSSRYIDVINNFLLDKSYGIFSQSFGMSTLSFICKKIDTLIQHPLYMFIGSPFLYTPSKSLFIKNRRSDIMKLNYQFKDLLFNSKNLESILGRLIAFNEDTNKIHKISQEITNPFLPIGLIYEKLNLKIKYLSTCTDKDFINYFSNPPINAVNFVIGSKYFSPGSNIYLETKNSVKSVVYKKWMLDEGKYLCYLYELQYKGTKFLEYVSKKNNELEDWDVSVIKCAKYIKTKIVFNTGDVSIPVSFYIDKFTPLLEDYLQIDTREGYGHWVGHNTFAEFYKEV